MSQYRAWRGAVEFSGFPVQLALYSLVKSSRGRSFRQVTPDGNATSNVVLDAATGMEVTRDSLRKGIEMPGGHLKPLGPDALAIIEQNTKTEVATPYQFCPATTVRWDLATQRFAVRADDKVPGSPQGVNILWNGLKSTGLAYVTQVSLRSGPDAILALEANEHGFWASLIPFHADLYDVPPHGFHDDEKAQTVFAQAVETVHGELIGEFDHPSFRSEYVRRYDEALDTVLSGEAPTTKLAPAQAVPDLMSGLEAIMAAKKPKKTKKAKAAA
jgi:non-homologous end joining protein Ku